MLFISPLTVPVGKKIFSLNLNVYRNTHHQTLNKAKVNYKLLMASQMTSKHRFNKISISYRLYPKTHRKCDISNILCVVDKFFCDALVDSGMLDDDNYLFLPEVKFYMGEVDKNNPRVEIEVTEIEK